ncbi:hypothetical protein [Spirochaeta cellobiosiphila]|uniref:hypothetical protein n=1 Tax=Spirochaeta cellobiosiphila TaxID=504483 RepID=UPI00040C9D00|nr:hypothetical protein [Spirochaeta cellobiosiphila]
MPKLELVVQSFLESLNKAQDQINKLSCSMSKIYHDDKFLRYFPVPNADLSEVEFDFAFAVREQHALKNKENKSTYREAIPGPPFLRSKAKSIVVNTTDILSESIEDEELSDIITSEHIRKELMEHVLSDLTNFAKKGLLNKKNRIRRYKEKLTKALIATIDKAFDEDPDYVAYIADKKEVDNQLDTALSKCIEDEITSLYEDLDNSSVEHKTADLDIIVDSDILRKLSPQVIQRIKVKASVRNYKWVADKNGSNLIAQDE